MAHMKKVFLLGGYDLEMKTIKGILESENIIVEDKELAWDNAYLSAYSDVFDRYPQDEYEIYGVELMQDIESVPHNYIVIDHHNSYQTRPSSLTQVCKLLGRQMSREERLIAANDERYIPGMLALGATKEEFDDIRSKDRSCQGVSAEDEDLAREALANKSCHSGLICVESKTKKFSPIVDALFPASHVLVYTDSEFTYYGDKRDVYYDVIHNKYPDVQLYQGGGCKGYFGAANCKQQIKNIVKEIIDMQVISKHIFLFPFQYTGKKISLHDFHTTNWPEENGAWKRVKLNFDQLDKGQEQDRDLYNELNYFYPHLHNVLYDSSDDSCIRHYERADVKDAKYIIDVSGETRYTLAVNSVNINYYSTGVGVLSIETSNHEYEKGDDILKINQYGRRLFHPFADDFESHIEGASSLKLVLGNGSEVELMNSSGNPLKPNSLSGDLKKLVCSLPPSEECEILPILDDRMFVLSWYKNDELSFSEDQDYATLLTGAESKDFWYKYVFVDGSEATCQNADLKTLLLQKATYPRWQKWGTLYGISRYSFVMLTNSGCLDFLLRYFETQYVKMSELALIQRASILRYTKALQECTNTKAEFKNINILSEYYEEYLHFLNNYRFTNISAQDQAIELYEMLCNSIHIKEDSVLLDQQFNELQEFMELQEEKKANKEAQNLNRLASYAVPVTIVSAIFGFFFHDNFGTEQVCDFHVDLWMLLTNPGNWFLYLSIAFTIWMFYRINKR